MDSSPTPPGKRPAFSGPFLLIVIACIVAGAIAIFLILRPNPSGKGERNTTTPPAAQQ